MGTMQTDRHGAAIMSSITTSPLAAIEAFITRYVALPHPEQAQVLALWTVHTWTFCESLPSPRTTPYLYIHSPEKQSGKTRLIEVLEVLARNPMRGTDMSPAVLFRAIESMRPTVMLDEVDAVWSGAKNDDLRGALNGGYKAGGHVWRVDRGSMDPEKFSTFCPKLLAGIDNGMLPDTIADRSIPIVLQRKRPGQGVEPFYSYDIEDEAAALVEQIDTWVRMHGAAIAAYRPAAIDGISDRAWEISMPLVSIAHFCGTAPAARAAIAKLLAPGAQTLTPGAQLLSDIRDCFAANGDPDRIFTSTILAHLGGNDWNGKLLGNRLRPYEISPRTLRINNQTAKGFYRSEFAPIWERYL